MKHHCQCGGGCCDPGLGWLEGISAQEAAQRAAALSAAWRRNELPNITQMAAAGMIDVNVPGYRYDAHTGCAGQPAPDLGLFVTGGSMAVGVAGAGTAIASATGLIAMSTTAILGAATAGLGAIVGIYSIIHGHHQQAVAREQSTLCSAVPAANNYLRIIDQALQQGLGTPEEAIHALDSLLSDFKSAVAGITKMNDSQCNAACYLIITLTAIVEFKKSAYQDLADAARAKAAADAARKATEDAARAAAPAQDVVPARPNVVADPGAALPVADSSYGGFYASRWAVPGADVADVPAEAASSSSLPDWLPAAAIVAAAFFLR